MFDKASLKLGLDKAVLQDINRKGSTNGVGCLLGFGLELNGGRALLLCSLLLLLTLVFLLCFISETICNCFSGCLEGLLL